MLPSISSRGARSGSWREDRWRSVVGSLATERCRPKACQLWGRQRCQGVVGSWQRIAPDPLASSLRGGGVSYTILAPKYHCLPTQAFGEASRPPRSYSGGQPSRGRAVTGPHPGHLLSPGMLYRRL